MVNRRRRGGGGMTVLQWDCCNMIYYSSSTWAWGHTGPYKVHAKASDEDDTSTNTVYSDRSGHGVFWSCLSTSSAPLPHHGKRHLHRVRGTRYSFDLEK